MSQIVKVEDSRLYLFLFYLLFPFSFLFIFLFLDLGLEVSVISPCDCHKSLSHYHITHGKM